MRPSPSRSSFISAILPVSASRSESSARTKWMSTDQRRRGHRTMGEPAPSKSRWSGLNVPFGRNARGRTLTAVTAVEVDGGVLRFAQALLKGHQPVVTRTGVSSLSFPADADRGDASVLGRAVSQALEELRVKPGQVVL